MDMRRFRAFFVTVADSRQMEHVGGLSVVIFLCSLLVCGFFELGEVVAKMHSKEPLPKVTIGKITALSILATSGGVGAVAFSICCFARKYDASGELIGNRLEQMEENQRNIYLRPEIAKQCKSCKHFHGRVYNANFLVCGFHPYGKESCSDWEG